MIINAKDVLQTLGIKVVKQSGSELIISCPFHNDKHPSASVNTKKLLFNCFSCGGMSLETFIARTSGKDKWYARRLISTIGEEEINKDSIAEKVRDLMNGHRDTDLSEDDLDDLKLQYTKYVKMRGIGKIAAKKWGVGYHKESQRLVFPIRDHAGTLKGSIGRLTKGIGPKYDTIQYCHSSRYLFGEYRLKNSKTRVVVESPITAIRMQEMGIPAVAVMKSKITNSQMTRLLMYDKVILAFDNDRAGMKGVRYALKKLPKAKVVFWPKDVDDMKEGEIKSCIESAKTAMKAKELLKQVK